MTINNTSKKMPTEDGNPTAGNTINKPNFPTSERNYKAFSTLRAADALKGHTLHHPDPTDGPVTYWAERWGLVATCPPSTRRGGFWNRSGDGCDRHARSH
ncbi:hypothetical protein F3K02_08460 [Hydrogenophaga sp. D2P1]|uniref:Uncharacterized protein n=1 Tax=Hydrogenophaga aromaticivorans TaxID=2610898 RepID=A0A7Y8KXR0_9BURK|nr:hypothetical protein [Hydrogenophaga aromaticivorans]NWF45283.1 hypothetical protein [Hydrogenophaga aromaticivorans]